MSRSGIKKQPYRKSRRFDTSCRCNGSCAWCRSNRLFQVTKAKSACDADMKDTQP